MEKHKYRIIINGGKEGKEPLSYHYGWTKNIRLHVTSQKAVIAFEYTTKRTPEDFIEFKVKLFRDSFRKVYLIHALLYDRGLDVKTIRIQIDDEIWDYDSQTSNFPFLFSMIKNQKMNLDPAWKDVVAGVLEIPKTKKDKDLRFCSAFAYLSAKNKSYRVDRFTNLWTAMNAYGNYLAKCYENNMEDVYDLSQLGKNKKKTMSLYGADTSIVYMLELMLKRPLDSISREVSDALWKDYYDIQSALRKIPTEDYAELYDEAWKALLDDTYIISDKFKDVQTCADYFNRPVFVFLLLQYPYHIRCNIFHGSYSTTLFSAYNDYELTSLGVVNYFIERYLNTEIPAMFQKTFWNDEKFESMKECMSYIKCVNGKDEFGKLIKYLEDNYKK